MTDVPWGHPNVRAPNWLSNVSMTRGKQWLRDTHIIRSACAHHSSNGTEDEIESPYIFVVSREQLSNQICHKKKGPFPRPFNFRKEIKWGRSSP